MGAAADSVTLSGVLTSTTLTAGTGADSIVVNANVASGYFDISAGSSGADDTLNFLPSSVSVVSTTIKGGAGTDQISLYGANDVVLDVSSMDSVFGGTGADTLLFTGSVLKSSIVAGSGNDSIVMAGTGMTGNTIDLGVGTDTIKFTTATNADDVTVTSTTISGAKSLTYEKAATAVGITTGAGADVVVFEGAVSGAGVISTNSGNDSIQFLKSAAFTGGANLGAGADSVYGADVISNSTISGAAGKDTFLISTLSNAAIYGGSDQDSVNITGSLYGATIDFGAGHRLFSLTVGATNSTIAGGVGNDTFLVASSNLKTASKIDGGAGKDSVSFGGVLSGGSVVGGADNDTLNFSAAVNNNAIVSGDAGSDLLLFSSTIATAVSMAVRALTASFLRVRSLTAPLTSELIKTHSLFLLLQRVQPSLLALETTLLSSPLVQTS